MNKRNTFYNIFWKEKACYNLFLLSKAELLDTKRVPLLVKQETMELIFPRIIISNFDVRDVDTTQIDVRNGVQAERSELFIDKQIELYKPVFTKILEDQFGKSWQKLLEDFKNPEELLTNIFAEFLHEDGFHFERTILNLLKRYNLIGDHIESFEGAEEHYSKELVKKKIQAVLSEETYLNLLRFIRCLKDLYTSEVYRGMYSSNQLQTKYLHSREDFNSRIKLFQLLMEAELLTYSTEDILVECHSCNQGEYQGVLRAKISPKRLEKLVCPICNDALTYFAPYDIDKILFDIVRSKDGLILDALVYLLETTGIKHETNVSMDKLKGLEIDCIFESTDVIYVVETKMFKTSTPNKLKQKLNKASYKLKSDLDTLSTELKIGKKIIPLLLVNTIEEMELLNLSAECHPDITVCTLRATRDIINSLKH